jgi:hypothetical protein
MLAFHNHRHRMHVSSSAVLGMNVLQHGMGCQRSLVPKLPVKVVDSISVRAGETDQRHIVIVPTNAVHNQESTDCRRART